MNELERTIATFSMTKLDRLIRREFGFFEATLQRWKEEGLPDVYVSDPYAEGNPFQFDFFEECLTVALGWGTPPLCPLFERTVLEENPPYLVVRDEYGRVHKVRSDRTRDDMPQHVGEPVGSRDDWHNLLKPRLDWRTPERWIALDKSLDLHADRCARGLAICRVNMIGAYMFLKELLGVQNVFYAFCDDRHLVEEMLDHWLDFMVHSIQRVQRRVPVFLLAACEDICYRNGPFVSPAMIEELLMPRYRQLIAEVRSGQAGPVHALLDCDGRVDGIIPLYMKAGFDAMSPFEAAAGCDVVRSARQHPGLVIGGGIDKRILSGSTDAMDRELERIIPFMLRRGGYIPTCDHMVPPEVSLENYLHYRRRIMELDH